MSRKTFALLACVLVLDVTASAEETVKPRAFNRAAPPVAAQGVRRKAPNVFGPGTALTRVGSMEFEAFDSDATYNDLGNVGAGETLSRFPTSITFLQAIVHLPSGALVTGIDLNYCDSNVFEDVGLVVYAGLSDGTGNAPIGTVTSNGASKGCGSEFADLSPAGFIVDNSANQLILVATFGTLDGTNSISGAIVHYQLQVSAAPAVATFPDVPTSDFGFQFVEALVSSGITGGCGGGLYCPDAPVTRRQMAIFIAKALGLHFP